MPDTPQTYANHGRFHPLFHFVLAPILLINLIVSIVWLVRNPGFASVWYLVMAVALFVIEVIR